MHGTASAMVAALHMRVPSTPTPKIGVEVEGLRGGKQRVRLGGAQRQRGQNRLTSPFLGALAGDRCTREDAETH